MPFLPLIISTLVPMLVGSAEKLFPSPGSGKDKRAWVEGFVKEFFGLLMSKVKVPSWLLPEVDEVEKLIGEAIEAAVAKIDP